MSVETKRGRRPDHDEGATYFAGYFDLVADGDIADVLRDQGTQNAELLAAVPADRHDYRYEAGKWSAKELFGHILDTERIFAYRALRFARNDHTPLPGMDQDVFVAGGGFEQRTWQSLLDEYRPLRASTVALAESFDEEVLSRKGNASGNDFTVRALLYFLAGHETHHVNVLKERYL